MPRTVRDTRLESRAARERLSPRHEPYWRQLYEGAHLGYRKGKRSGVWLARWRPSGGRYQKITLGLADDTEDANGRSILDYRQAQNAARIWCEVKATQGDRAQAVGPYTVRQALEDYFAEYEGRGGKAVNDARSRARTQILPQLGDLEVQELTAAKVKEWHREMAKSQPRLRTRHGAEQQYRSTDSDPDTERRRRATANRVLSILKAALNHAWREGRVASDDAWRRVTPFRGADAARVRYLAADEITRLVNAAESPFRELLQGALYTGARYGELTRLIVADFNPDAGTLAVRVSKSSKPRHVILTEEGQAFFRETTAGMPKEALIFARSNGAPWGKSHQQRPLMQVCSNARINPPASFHVLRHTYASHLAMRGVPLHVIAANLGHSDTRMVDKHYGHLAPSYIADAIRGAGLGYVVPTGDEKVIPLRPG